VAPNPLDYLQVQAWGNAGVLSQAATEAKMQLKPKTVSEFTDALQLIWPVLPEKAIENAVKDFHKRLQGICVSQRWAF